jgi:hypothetical protein
VALGHWTPYLQRRRLTESGPSGEDQAAFGETQAESRETRRHPRPRYVDHHVAPNLINIDHEQPPDTGVETHEHLAPIGFWRILRD